MSPMARQLLWAFLLFTKCFDFCVFALVASKEVDVLSKALGFFYRQGGTVNVMERSEGLENYSGFSLVEASVKASNGNKGHASGIINALLGACYVNRQPEKALEVVRAYDCLDFLKPDLVALCLTYAVLEETRIAEASVFLTRANNLFEGDQCQSPASTRHVDCNKLGVHGIRVLHDNPEFFVVSKPSGMVCYHSSASSNNPKRRRRRSDLSLEECLMSSGVPLSSLNKEGRGMVHRIDRGTSGCIVLAKSNRQHAVLLSQFFCRNVQKSYQALICCDRRQTKLASEGVINLDIDGRPAISSYELETTLGAGHSRVRVRTKQGRRHQVRIHCANGLQSPILLDPLYNGQASMKNLFRHENLKATLPKLRSSQKFCLHAESLSLPELGIECRAPLPDWWVQLERDLCNMNNRRQ